MVGSCGKCASCRQGLENYCEVGMILTYNSEDQRDGGITRGGYSESITVDESFALRVPQNLDLAAAAPLLCAGITTYSPLRHWNAGKGKRVGVVGLGGLGHMAVKFANALGAHVALFTTSPNKAEDAMRLGAHEVIISKNANEMEKNANSFDFILDTVSADHDMNALLNLLKLDGTLTLVGAPEKPLGVAAFNIIPNRRSLSGSGIGGIRETQEMLDFCGERGIVCDIEKINIQQINEAYERMLRSDVKYRFVIDIASLRT
jgi:alcohol dehydrogenase (NADP+)